MPDILRKLRAEPDLFHRRLLLAGYLTEELKTRGIRPIVVGGHAVEIYTFQDYTTHDLDLVSPGRELVSEILQLLGFEKMSGARHWIHEDLELALEIPDDRLAGDLNRLLELEIEGLTVFVIGAEDLIIDRLNAFVHWRSISDYEQALKIYLNHSEELDQEYLATQASANEVQSGLQKLRADCRRFLER